MTGAELRRLRLAANLTQAGLAWVSGMSRETLSRAEREPERRLSKLASRTLLMVLTKADVYEAFEQAAYSDRSDDLERLRRRHR